jgi:hypothetical protein
MRGHDGTCCKLVEGESCNDGGDQRDGTAVEIREKGRLWRLERWGDGGDQSYGRLWKSQRRGDG